MVTRVETLFTNQQSHINYFFDHLDESRANAFIDAVDACRGAIIFSGVGKSAFIAERLARMFVSIGIKAHFLSPTEALHGDLGVVGPEDLAVFLSKSGSSEELLALAPHIRRRAHSLIALVCHANSLLGSACDMMVELPLDKELCPFDLAPTTSSAIQILFGDVCVVALMQRRGFTEAEYAINHPAGAIGKKLSLLVRDLMLTGDALPLVSPTDRLLDSLVTLSSKGCGCLIVAVNQQLLGIFTDGDLRRILQRRSHELDQLTLGDVMHVSPKSIAPTALAIDALRCMQEVRGQWITELPVVHEGVFIGLIRMHQIVAAGISS